MHIVFVAEAFSGGVARQLAHLAELLPPAGVRCSFLIGQRPGEPIGDARDRLAAADCRIELVPELRRGLGRPDLDRAARKHIQARLDDLKPDLVHTHAAKAGYLGRKAAFALGIRAVHTPHVFPFEAAPFPANLLYAWLERRASRRGQAVICLTEAQQTAALRHRLDIPARIPLVPNGVDTDYFRPPTLDERKAARARWNLPTTMMSPMYGFVGRLCRQKNPDLLIDAAIRILSHQGNARFLIAGTGPLLEAAQHRLHHGANRPTSLVERFHWLGDVRDTRSVYWAVDGMLLTSRWEGMPYSVLESLACGVPVAATATPGTTLLLDAEYSAVTTRGVNDAPSAAPGWLAETADGLAEALESVADATGAQREVQSAAARRRAKAYDIGRWRDQLMAVYRSVLDGPAPTARK